MIRNHHRVAACFAALVLFAAGSARAAAIDSVTYRGRGCPQGSVGTSIAGDGSAMTLIFDRFIASEAPNVSAMEAKKNCMFEINLDCTTGEGTATASSRGYVQLPDGVSATHVSKSMMMMFPMSVNEYEGLLSQDYVVDHTAIPVCRSGRAKLRMKIAIRVKRVAGATAQITQDSLDLSID